MMHDQRNIVKNVTLSSCQYHPPYNHPHPPSQHLIPSNSSTFDQHWQPTQAPFNGYVEPIPCSLNGQGTKLMAHIYPAPKLRTRRRCASPPRQAFMPHPGMKWSSEDWKLLGYAEATQSATLCMLCTLCSLHQVATLAAIRTRHATLNYFVLPAARDCMALLRVPVLSYRYCACPSSATF